MTEVSRDIQIEWEGKPEVVTIKKIGLKERNDILRGAIGGSMRMVGTDMHAQVDPWRLQEIALEMAIVKAPFPINAESIGKLDPNLADRLYSEIDEFNNITGQTARKKE